MNNSNGWIKLHRKMLDNPVVMKDADHLAVWVYLLLEAAHEDYKTLLGGKPITLKPGQLITGRKKIAAALGINEHKADRVLKLLKSAHQIEQQGTSRGSVITILQWDEYQRREQPNEQQMSNSRATSEQQVSTIQEDKELKKIKKSIFRPPTVDEVRAYCLERNNNIDPERFIDYYSQQKWKLANGNKMSDWKAAVRNWERRDAKKKAEPKSRTNFYQPEPPKYRPFKPDPEIDAVQMPEEIREKMKGMFT